MTDDELTFVRRTLGIWTEHDDLIRAYWRIGYRGLGLVHVVRKSITGSGQS